MNKIRKRISEYIEMLDKEGLLVRHNVREELLGRYIGNLTFDSREITEGTLFVCKGLRFKAEYLDAAFEHGATAAVSEVEYDYENLIIVKDIRKVMALLAKIYFCDPTNELKIIAITGTKGKSTSLYDYKAIMENSEVAKDKFGYVSTIDTYDGINLFKSHLTTPESTELDRRFRNMLDCGLEYCAIEASSQALKYDRTCGMTFEIGAFTNFGRDHISDTEHTDIDDYFRSKLKIFDQSRNAVVNLDCDRADQILAYAKGCANLNKIYTYSKTDTSADFVISDLHKNPQTGRVTFDLTGVGTVELGMPGFFNAENATLAAIMALHFGATAEDVKKGLLEARAEGRMELYEDKEREVAVIADFAHNRLSFESLFKSVKNEFPGWHIHVVFGVPGNKAFTRREDFPKCSAEYADYAYISEDDPAYERLEDLCQIAYDNLIKFGGKGEIILDREEAVKKAVEKAPRKTAVLLLAKGNEAYQKREDRLDPIVPDNELARILTGNQ